MKINRFIKCYGNPVITVMVIIFFLIFTISFEVMAKGDVILQGNVIPQGGIIVKGDDGKEIRIKPSKMWTQYEPLQAGLDAGQLSSVESMLDIAAVKDEQKDAKLRESLATKTKEAEQLFNQYFVLKEVANGDMTQLQKAKMLLEEASAIWTDNGLFQQEQKEINDLIILVESGEYEKWQARKKAEEEIHDLIAEAKACQIDSDCVRVGFGCPFGCGTAINKTKLKLINTKIYTYNNNQEFMCMYDCYVPASLKEKCVEKVCRLQ